MTLFFPSPGLREDAARKPKKKNWGTAGKGGGKKGYVKREQDSSKTKGEYSHITTSDSTAVISPYLVSSYLDGMPDFVTMVTTGHFYGARPQ